MSINENIQFIIGGAGTGKTTKIINMMMNKKFEKVMFLALTHSAVNNLKERYIKVMNSEQNDLNEHFKTIHSYFKIIIKDNITLDYINTPNKYYKYLIIDEFSLISVHLLNQIIKYALDYDVKLFILGDILQLPSVKLENEIVLNDTVLNLLSTYFNKIDVMNNLNVSLKVIKHFVKTILSESNFKIYKHSILTENLRSEKEIITFVNTMMDLKIDNNTKKKMIKEKIIYLSDISKDDNLFDEFVKGLKLSSRYSLLSELNDYIKNKNKLKNGKVNNNYVKTKIGLSQTDELILMKSLNKHFLNGDKVKYQSQTNDYVIISNEDETRTIYTEFENVLPVGFLTIHKAQGRENDNVFIVIDSLFEPAMIYTAITRAVKSFKFIVINRNNEDEIVKNLIDDFNALGVIRMFIN